MKMNLCLMTLPEKQIREPPLARWRTILRLSGLKTANKTLVGGINEVNEEKANGKGISFSINESGGLRVTYDDGK